MSAAIINQHGQRKYLTPSEMDAFIRTARKCPLDVRAFCWMIAFTGCRISEALSLTRDSIDFQDKQIIIKCLKKKGRIIFRSVPVPPEMLKLMERWMASVALGRDRLWPWSRMTGYRRITEVMRDAGVKGNCASPKGLRHGFGVRAIQASVPLTMIQRWLGHADIKTTAIYTQAMGPEEREIAARMWRGKAAWHAARENAHPHRDESSQTDWADPPEPAAAPSPRSRDPRASDRKSGADHRKLPFFSRPAGQTRLPKRTPMQTLTCSLIHFWLQCIEIYHCLSIVYSSVDRNPLPKYLLPPNAFEGGIGRPPWKTAAGSQQKCRTLAGVPAPGISGENDNGSRKPALAASAYRQPTTTSPRLEMSKLHRPCS